MKVASTGGSNLRFKLSKQRREIKTGCEVSVSNIKKVVNCAKYSKRLLPCTTTFKLKCPMEKHSQTPRKVDCKT